MLRTAVLSSSLALLTGCVDPGGCPMTGTGTLTITSTGLPDGVDAGVSVGDRLIAGSQTVTLGAGPKSLTAAPVTVADPRVRTVYAATLSNDLFCLRDGATQAVTVTWAKVPTSNRLWVSTRNAVADVLGFDSATLAASATVPAAVSVKGPMGGALAFDRAGNLWGVGATTSDPTLVRFPAASLASSGTLTADAELEIDFGCVPLARGLAFDAQGNAWVSSPCRDAVFRIPPSQLTPGARHFYRPEWSLAVQDPGGLAFDATGRLWVASMATNRILGFEAAGLAGDAPPTPTIELAVFARATVGDTSKFSPSWVAFDANGDLWANDFGSNTFFRVAGTQLDFLGPAEVQPQVRVVVGVLAVLEGFLFDEGGGLWSAGAQGRIIRLSPSQLTTSSTSGSPTTPETVIESADLGSAANLAIFPAPVGTGL